MEDLTLVTCSYNTPHITMTMLRSWVNVNIDLTNKLFLIDNSTDENTALQLHDNEINFIRNPGGKHFEGVQIALDMVKTRYMLLVDTDVIYYKNLKEPFERFKNSNTAIMGEVCGDRGGQTLYDRIYPWFCFIDLEKIKKYDIKFANMKLIEETDSGSFYMMDVINTHAPCRRYDVGATFFKEINDNNLGFVNEKLEPEYFFHYEGMSWRGTCASPQLVRANNENEKRYYQNILKLNRISLKGVFDS